MFGGGPRDASLALPTWPLDQLYAEPARRFIEARGGEVRIGAPARVHLENGRGQPRRRARRAPRGGRGRCRGAVVRARRSVRGDTAPVDALRAAAAATQPSPIASVNLWLDRRILRTPFLGLPGRTMQWVFDKEQLFETETSHLTLVSSGADDVMALQNEELIALALRELREALPEARAAKVAARVGRARAARDVLAGARAAEAAGDRDGRRGPGARRRLDRDRPARYDRRRGHQRPPRGRGHLMNSVVVHYQEIALKGRTGRGSSRGWCATSRPRRAIST